MINQFLGDTWSSVEFSIIKFMSSVKKCYSRGGQALGKTVGEVFDEVPPYITTIEELKKRAISNWNTRKPTERIVERLEERKEGYLKQYEKTFTASSRRAYESYDDAIDIVKEEGGLND